MQSDLIGIGLYGIAQGLRRQQYEFRILRVPRQKRGIAVICDSAAAADGYS